MIAAQNLGSGFLKPTSTGLEHCVKRALARLEIADF
jgi:hypothetical protein